MLSVIIINYKNEERTVLFVKEELIKINIPHIIVIVNNSATFESNRVLVEKLNSVLITDITVSPNLEFKCYVISHFDNLGFAKGNNLGAEFSMKHFCITYFLFSNNDICFINNNVVEKLIERMNSLANVALIGPKVVGLDGKRQSPEPFVKFWNRYIWMYWMTPFLSSDKKIKLFKLDYSEKASEGIHYKIMGSFFLVKAIDFMKCGMMDPKTFLYAEEMILSDRLKSIEKYTYYYPEVSVLHEHGETISQYFDALQMLNTRFESESYYYHRYHGISSLSILIGKLSLKYYHKFKNILRK